MFVRRDSNHTEKIIIRYLHWVELTDICLNLSPGSTVVVGVIICQSGWGVLGRPFERVG